MRQKRECDRYKGRSKAECERYGKPCIGAEYTSNDDVHKYQRTSCRCIVCGMVATEVHHWPPIGRSAHGMWTLETPKGWHVLKPSLFALCRRCHERFHANFYSADWEWETPEAEEAYWNGSTTQIMEYRPHSKNLYELGHWLFRFGDKGGFTYKEVMDEDGQWKAVRTPFRAGPA